MVKHNKGLLNNGNASSTALLNSARAVVQFIPPHHDSFSNFSFPEGLTLYAIREKPLSRLFTLNEVNHDSSGLIEQHTGAKVLYDSIVNDYEDEIGSRVRSIALNRLERGITSPLNFGHAFKSAARALPEHSSYSEELFQKFSSKDIFDRILSDEEASGKFFSELEAYVNSTTIPYRNYAVLDYLEKYFGAAHSEGSAPQELHHPNHQRYQHHPNQNPHQHHLNFALMDVGCSNMGFLGEARKRFPSAYLAGLDVYEIPRVSSAEGIDFVKADILDKSLPELDYDNLDVVTCFALLNLHLDEEGSVKALYNMALGLKDNGLLIAGSESIHPFIAYGTSEDPENVPRIYSYAVIRKEGTGQEAHLSLLERISSEER
ncbi:hypothetical protein D6764_01370 [Candidatus Woesearchaeota archaeon]|nr:MAG: hypothetical protein D6764_01370 [Candidatus Woesearchaeota archaeon]